MKKHTERTQDRAAAAFAELTEIIARLRSPGGCPWDMEQTHESLKPYVIEESYEVVDAIDRGGPQDLCEELGDMLLQIMLQARISEEDDQFDVADVVKGLSAKLVHRHPHVFGDTQVDGSEEVLVNWEKLKKKEKKNRGLFDGLPPHLPGLQKAARMGEKAGRVGFDWERPEQVRAKVMEEIAEVDEAVTEGDAKALEHEIGDMLFAASQWARHLGVHPEEAVRGACGRFSKRFAAVSETVAQRGKEIDECSIDELEEIWQEVKRR